MIIKIGDKSGGGAPKLPEKQAKPSGGNKTKGKQKTKGKPKK